MNQWEQRAGYANARDFFAIRDPEVAPKFIVAQDDVIDLTGKDAARWIAQLDTAGWKLDGVCALVIRLPAM